MLTDPQLFNEYAYARNNPLMYVDPLGEAIQLSNDPAEQEGELNAICSAAGILPGQCSYYLYANAVKDSNGNTSYYVGIYTNGADAKGTSFQNPNDVAAAIGSVINDQRVVQLDLVAPGTTVTDIHEMEETIGPVDVDRNIAPGATYQDSSGNWHIALLDPSTAPGTLPSYYMTNDQSGVLNQGIIFGHELGHLKKEWSLTAFERFEQDDFNIPVSDPAAVDLENKVRKLQNPNAPTRKGHNPPPPQ